LAGQAFKDKETLALLRNFVPILVDGDVDKGATKEYSVRGYPNTKFITKKGEVLGDVGGYVETSRFLTAVKSALKKNGKVKPSKKYKALLASVEKIDKSMAKKRYSDAMKEIAKIEKIGHKGPEFSEAIKTKKAILEIADERFASASALEEKEPKKAKTQFTKIAKDFRGLDVGKKASKKAKAITARLKKEKNK
jgi:hypothetical protein